MLSLAPVRWTAATGLHLRVHKTGVALTISRMNAPLPDFRQAFLAFALEQGVLKFGSFTTKSGRNTPYFFNSGLFNDGESLRRLGEFYADAYIASGIECDQLFGPAYKGITLATATAIALAARGLNLGYNH